MNDFSWLIMVLVKELYLITTKYNTCTIQLVLKSILLTNRSKCSLNHSRKRVVCLELDCSTMRLIHIEHSIVTALCNESRLLRNTHLRNVNHSSIDTPGMDLAPWHRDTEIRPTNQVCEHLYGCLLTEN